MHVAVPGAYSSLQCATKPRFHSGTAVSLAWARGLLVAMPTANANARILPESPAESSVTQSLRLPKVVGEVAPLLKLVKGQAKAPCFVGNAELMVAHIADIDDHDFYLRTVMPGG